MPPEKRGSRLRGIQNELATEGLAKQDSPLRVRAITCFHEWNQFAAKEGLKILRPTIVLAFIRWRRIVVTAFVAVVEITAAIRNGHKDHFGRLATVAQVPMVSP